MSGKNETFDLYFAKFVLIVSYLLHQLFCREQKQVTVHTTEVSNMFLYFR